MFNLKKININSKNEYIAMILENDAKELSLQANDKVKIFSSCGRNKKYLYCQVEIIDNIKKKTSHKNICLKKGDVGLLESAFEKLEIVENKKVSLSLAPKPKSVEYIKDKFNGKKLTEKKFEEIIKDIIDNKYSKVETTYFVLACTAHQLDIKETIGLTKAMVKAGRVLDFKTKKTDIIVDKHCIGGVPNNRTTMLIVPIVSAAGLKIPKTSSRSITSPAGTADTMEVLTNVDIELSKMHNIVNNVGGCIVWGGGLDLSPADDIIIQVEHPLEIDSQGQMIASILSKKKAAGATHVLIDIPIGKTAKVKTYLDGLTLKKKFEKVGSAINIKIKTIITDGSEPVGRGIGPLNEANDILSILKLEDSGLDDLKEKSLMMSAEIFEMAKFVKKGKGYKLAKEILESKKALKKFEEIIDKQGRKEKLNTAKYKFKYQSNLAGKIKSINNKKISKLAFILGAPEDKSAGLILNKKSSDIVKKTDTLFELHTNSKQKLKFAQNYINDNIIYKIK